MLVFYVCGADHAAKCIPGRAGFRNPRYGLVVVDRDGSSSYARKSRPDDLMFGCAAAAGGGLSAASSTAVRNLLRHRTGRKGVAEEATRLLGRRVYDLICEQEWFGCTHGRFRREDSAPKSAAAKAKDEESGRQDGDEDGGAVATGARADGGEDLDLLDAVSRVHDQWIEEGRQEAIASLDGTDEDALRLGLHHGSKLGYELAYMDGVIATLLALCDIKHAAGTASTALTAAAASTGGNRSGGVPRNPIKLTKRARATAVGLQNKLSRFPLDRPASEEFQNALDVLRAQFRLLCAQAKMPDVHMWQNGGKRKEEMSF